MKDTNKQNTEIYNPKEEKQNPVNNRIEKTKTLVKAMGIEVEKLMSKANKKEVVKVIKSAMKGNLKSRSNLEAQGYNRINLISTKEGFNLEKIIDEQENVKWDESSIPTYIHNSLKHKVVIGLHEDGSDKLAIYTKEPPR